MFPWGPTGTPISSSPEHPGSLEDALPKGAAAPENTGSGVRFWRLNPSKKRGNPSGLPRFSRFCIQNRRLYPRPLLRGRPVCAKAAPGPLPPAAAAKLHSLFCPRPGCGWLPLGRTVARPPVMDFQAQRQTACAKGNARPGGTHCPGNYSRASTPSRMICSSRAAICWGG